MADLLTVERSPRRRSIAAEPADDVAEQICSTILVVEDDDGNRDLVRRVLEAEGHTVLEAGDGPSALVALTANRPDAVVLDLGLPTLGGLAVLERIRSSSSVPVLLLTARSDEDARVEGLDAGADDYMVKPYSIEELAARIRALLRRSRPRAAVQFLRFGSVSIDLAARKAFVDGRQVALTPKEYGVLSYLAVESPRTLSREALLQHVWTPIGWQDPTTVTEHVRRIRMKLAAAGVPSELIDTVRRCGYRIS